MIQVLKFGGSSVANATNISRVLDIVGAASAKGRVMLVCSAIKGCTDSLLALARLAEKQHLSVLGMAVSEASSVAPDDEAALQFAEGVRDLKAKHLEIIRRLFTGSERDEAEAECHALFAQMASAPAGEMVTWGEVFSTRIIARKLACDGVATKWLDSTILVIKDHKDLTYNNISAAVALEPQVRVFVAPGFIASNYEGGRTTLGRGGSDLSAAIYAAALKADSLQIWTDVPGIMTANPSVVPTARTIPEMSYRAALDMASHGAKVLYAPTVEPAMQAGIAINILNTFDPGNPGTTVRDITLGGWAGITGTKDGTAGESLLCLVGENPPEEEGFASASCARLEACLKKAGIKTLSSSSDGRNVYATVRLAVEDQAVAAIHREFFESVPQSILNLYVAGCGAVGKAFLELLAAKGPELAKRTGKVLRLCGIADSHRFIVDSAGIPPERALAILEGDGGEISPDFASAVKATAPRRSIFVDLTDSETLYREFTGLLREGINIVTSNRRSLAVPYVEYAAIMSAAAENGCFVRYETTVGSALPLLESISRSAAAGEEILGIEAVVSCTLNRILSSYARYPGSFAETVRKAQQEGLTEADPRADLAGEDALRKLLIMAREAGVALEASDVEITPAVPASLLDPSIPLEEFYTRLEALEPGFDAEEKAAARSQCRQRFLATLEKDPSSPLGYRASIAVRNVPRNHPAFRILGTENAIILRSAYHPYPLVIQGTGEGAQMAAGGILNDILRG